MDKDFLKTELLKLGYFKTPDGRQLYELTVEELQRIYKEIARDRKNGTIH